MIYMYTKLAELGGMGKRVGGWSRDRIRGEGWRRDGIRKKDGTGVGLGGRMEPGWDQGAGWSQDGIRGKDGAGMGLEDG